MALVDQAEKLACNLFTDPDNVSFIYAGLVDRTVETGKREVCLVHKSIERRLYLHLAFLRLFLR